MSTAASLKYLDQPSLINAPMKDKPNTKEYAPLSKCIYKGMMLENESANPSGMLVSISGNTF